MTDTFDVNAELVQIAALAADHEILNNRRTSSVPNPDGSAQVETQAEMIHRAVETGVMHLIETGLLAVSPNAETIITKQGVPLARHPIPET